MAQPLQYSPQYSQLPQYSPPQPYGPQYAQPPTWLSANKNIVALGVILVVLALVYMSGFGQSATSGSSSTVQPAYNTTYNTTLSDPVIKFAPPIDNTNINTGSAAPSIDGATTVVAPSPTVVVNGQKAIRIYSGLNFTGTEVLIRAGESSIVPLGKYNAGTYVPEWKSMRVDPGVRIMFTLLDMGPFSYAPIRDARKSFATGRSDVPDIETWLRGQARISGPNNWGYGSINLNKPLTRGNGTLNIKALTDDEWNAEITSEYYKCMTYVAQMKATNPSKYSDADCASLTSDTFGKTYT